MENRILGIGNQVPNFSKTAVVSLENGKEFKKIHATDLVNENDKWTVLFWWPKDFTFVCPTEITAFNDEIESFEKQNAQLIGASTDSEYVHLAWRESHPGLRKLKFPMLADTSKSLAQYLGILEQEEKVAYRATFIINPEGIIKWVSVTDLSVGRSVHEVLRVLTALQTGDLTPCNWEAGEQTL